MNADNPNPYATLKPVTQVMTNPHFETIGGEAVIIQLVEKFYFYMNILPEAAGIRTMHAADLSHTKKILVQFLIEWLGGPKIYSSERGHPSLRKRHMHFPIGEVESNAWMSCMRHAMEDVVSNAILRQQLEQSFTKTANFIRNK
ncbi:MAG TPA: group II truncated hemoglobin [Methylotenera sp.]|nr:group II truncated hemoglobin [Methylotenera sp.]HPH04898.1 group II truncated hemoglobin [Methylotenera sp.]